MSIFECTDDVRRQKIAASLEPFRGAVTDEDYMCAALALAHLGAQEDEVPVGCVIVRGSEIIAADYNSRECTRTAVSHAETNAISQANRALGGWRLPGCTMYVTLEPCPMCAGAIWNARIPRVVIGAKDAKAGAMGSLINIFSYPLNYKPEVCFGVCEAECRGVVSDFFGRKRKK